jgi:hypothetical protein
MGVALSNKMPTRQIAEWSISGHWCARIRRLGLKLQKRFKYGNPETGTKKPLSLKPSHCNRISRSKSENIDEYLLRRPPT